MSSRCVSFFGRFFLVAEARAPIRALPIRSSRKIGVAFGVAFAGLLVGLPIAAGIFPIGALRVFAAFYESGALVFGGGHVVLPLLQARVVSNGWIDSPDFLAGYGAAQAIPGPLFTFAAYLGTAMHGPVSGVAGAALALFAIYLPSFLLVGAIVPFWNTLLQNSNAVAVLDGVNASVVGLLLAALYTPVWSASIRVPADAALAIVAFLFLYYWKAPPWAIVALSAFVTTLMHLGCAPH